MGLSSGAYGGSRSTEVGGHRQALAGLVPPGTVTDQHGMGLGADLLADLGQVDRHLRAEKPPPDLAADPEPAPAQAGGMTMAAPTARAGQIAPKM